MTNPPPITERQAKIDVLTAEFRAAQQRRQARNGALWNRTEATLRDAVVPPETPATPLEH